MSVTITYHLAQACLCGYVGFLSQSCIRKLLQYEQNAERAAQYSNIAAEQLHKTRTTQAAGAISILSSLSCSLYLVISSRDRGLVPLALCIVNSVGLSLTYSHISNFWDHKAKVPMAKDYNDAISLSNVMRQYLVGLSLSWWLAAAYYLPKALIN